MDVHRSRYDTCITEGHANQIQKGGCIASIIISVVLTLALNLLLRAC
jgi:hypothetical protein